jgi:KDO2-lipid IV(A) lauroyltransferase
MCSRVQRRRVVLSNLKLCFPQLDDAGRRALARRHFRAFARSLLDHGVLWWGSRTRIQRMVRIEGIEHWRAVADRPVIWLAPHFVGLDMGGSRIITEWHAASMYSQQEGSRVRRYPAARQDPFHQAGPVRAAGRYPGLSSGPYVKGFRSITCPTWTSGPAIRCSFLSSVFQQRP